MLWGKNDVGKSLQFGIYLKKKREKENN